jgi:alkylation response protein AidB-like acyl-CoA dehydrogenase
LFEVLGTGDKLGSGLFAEIDPDTARGILDEVRKLAEGPLADSYVDSDRNPPVFDPATGSVTMPAAFKKSYAAWQDAEWWRLETTPEYGGTPAPRSLVWSIAELVLGANPAIWMFNCGPAFANIIHEAGTAEQRDDGADRARRRVRRRRRTYQGNPAGRRDLAYRRCQAVHHLR